MHGAARAAAVFALYACIAKVNSSVLVAHELGHATVQANGLAVPADIVSKAP